MSAPTPTTGIPAVPYTFRAALKRVVDGDTQVYKLDFRAHRYGDITIRLIGVNTPEKIGVTRDAGLAATAYSLAWLVAAGTDDWPLVIETTLDKDDKYGRLLGKIWRVSDQRCLNADLVADGQAVEYWGGSR